MQCVTQGERLIVWLTWNLEYANYMALRLTKKSAYTAINYATVWLTAISTVLMNTISIAEVTN